MTDIYEELRFVRATQGAVIKTPGNNFSGVLTSIWRAGPFEVWRKTAGTYWNGVGCSRGYSPAELWVTRVFTNEDGSSYAKVLERRQPGRR